MLSGSESIHGFTHFKICPNDDPIGSQKMFINAVKIECVDLFCFKFLNFMHKNL